jgi:pyruvate formate lyase activating enzyme
MNTGLIFDIKRYSINDGPGIRVTVFMKGCPLSCAWCHNPESISPKVQKMYSQSKCIGCSECVDQCPENALILTKDGITTDINACTLCGICANVCPTKAMEMTGKLQSVDNIIKMIERETVFMDQSEGGVTFSGGEPLQQSKFLIQLLEACGRNGLHRTVDTSGFARTETLLEVAKHTDHFLYDLKMMDSEKHKKFTGVPNEKILSNLKILSETGASINIRIPFIKGVNSDDKNMEETATFIAALAGDKKIVNLLPYHNIMTKKYQKLGGDYLQDDLSEPSTGEKERAIEIFKKHGITAIIGG